jgi:cardiolipin synthase A/B
MDMVHDRSMAGRRRSRRSRRDLVLVRVSPVLAVLIVVLVAAGLLAARGGSRGAAQPLVVPYRAGERGATIGDGTVPASLLIEPRDGAKQLVRLIDRTQRTLFVETYILSDRQIIRALERAAAQDVAVDVLLEPRPLGLGTQPQRVADELAAAGVSVRWTRPVFALTHAKFMVSDDRVAILASANFSRAGLHSNRDLLVVDRRPGDVRLASAVFRADWDGLTPAVRDPNMVLAPDNARVRLVTLLRRARRWVDIYAEELRDSSMEQLFAGLSRRGVTVRVVLAAGQTPLAGQWLARHDVEVRLLGNPYVHAKMILVDGREAFIGSENLSAQSLDRNREVGVLVRGPILERLARTFNSDWGRASQTGS